MVAVTAAAAGGSAASLGAGVLALGAHLARQFGKFKNRKIAFMKALADSLYFTNLDNNAGVLYAKPFEQITPAEWDESFELEHGECIAGPCKGSSLKAVDVVAADRWPAGSRNASRELDRADGACELCDR